MVDLVSKLIRSIQDEYKLGAESRSGKPIIYLDPNKLDIQEIGRIMKKKTADDLTEDDRDRLADIVARQIDDQNPGMSAALTREEKLYLLGSSLKDGPFANSMLRETGICLINEPIVEDHHPDHLLKGFGLVGEGRFNPAHMKPVPGDEKTWDFAIGEHEGEHCNQEPVMRADPERDLKILDGEIRSDAIAIKTLREQGKFEEAQTLIDIRALTAAEGDHTHASGIFLNDPDYKGVTAVEMEAAKNFKDQMVSEVSMRNGISYTDAAALRHEDPQAFVKVVNQALEEGTLPHRLKPSDEISQAVADRMGITVEELNERGILDPEAMEVSQKMHDAGEFQREPNAQDLATKKYIEAYSGAVKRRFNEDTTPIPAPTSEADAAPSLDDDAPDEKGADKTAESEADSPEADESAPPVVGPEAEALFSRLMSGQTVASASSLNPTSAPASTAHVPTPAQTSPKLQAATV